MSAAPVFDEGGGVDPLVALREDDDLGDADVEELVLKLERLDAKAERGPWTRTYLELIDAQPSVRAADLDRLSPRGRRLLSVLRARRD